MSDFPKPFPSNRTPKPVEEHVPVDPPQVDEDIMFIMKDKLKAKSFHDPDVVRFIMAYLEYRDIRQAGDAVGLTYRRASSIRRRKDVADCIAEITAQSAVLCGIDADEVVGRVKEMAFVDPARLVDRSTGAAYTNMWDIPAEVRRAIKKFKVKNLYDKDPNGFPVKVGELVEFELHDKLKASGMLGAEVGKFKETVVHEHGPTKDMREILLGGLERAKSRAKALEAAEVVDVTPASEDEDA